MKSLAAEQLPDLTDQSHYRANTNIFDEHADRRRYSPSASFLDERRSEPNNKFFMFSRTSSS